MTLVIPVDYAQVTHVLRLVNDPQDMVVTTGVSIPNLSTTIDLGTIPEDLTQAFATEWMPNMDPDWTLVETVVKGRYDAGPDDYLIGVSTSTEVGTAGAYTQLPQNSAYLVHKRTAHAGRTGRGRMYLPGIPESLVSDIGVIAGATITTLNAMLADYLTAVNAVVDVGEMVLLHNDPGAGAALIPYPITSLTLDPVIATQRRRLRR